MIRSYFLGFTIAFLGLFLFQSCADGQQVAGSKQDLSAAEFKAVAESPDITLLDIRTSGEFASGAIAGAKNIDWYNGENFKSEVSKLNKDKPVYMYCASGNRSGSAIELLKAMGFKEVYHLQGGMGAWRRAGYPVK